MKQNKKGFTLAELLIVVAIIGVLVAISIPIFSKQLEKARDAATIANIRSAYAEAMSEYMDPDPIDKDKPRNAYPSGWVGSGYHLWLNYNAGQLNTIDVVIQVENTKSTAELKKMLTKSNLPFKLNVQGSKLPSGLYIIAFGFNDNGFTNTATLAPIPDVWKDLDVSAQ
ncbi:MAG: prepilin-type N-terminal cleavage/methylation domain-containing protein [Lachnospiraceae bacterium]|jgi:prepilin-type N-terminal cleavage/methylation domain-containing protein